MHIHKRVPKNRNTKTFSCHFIGTMSLVSLALFFVLIWTSETTKASPNYDIGKLSNNNSDPFNPGPCNTQSHGQIKLVRDRNEEDRVVVCTENANSASWKFLDGSSTVGEYFDPAYDCSDVVDRVPAAKDGLYWIKNEAVDKVVKVWCDVTTDGGGYMLVAKKDGPVSWTVPSSNETVHPHGDPHWSSIFGGLDMLDIRFQFSTTTKFDGTKADWSFRLANKRPFSNLLVRDNGGCTEHNPGIGDITYVKDLLVGKVVNTHFRCSLFSAHLSDKIGWGMMNSCLKMSCPNGFAIFGDGKLINLDDHGSFSYSTYKNATRSGILHSSTAFIGCSGGKCCACYGPRGGRINYCLKNCTAINGGTITKNVWTWIWIRSSVPKRVWRKCIEIIKTDSSGKKQTYRINEETGIEEKGSCAYSEDIKRSGSVLVAPNEKAMKKIPAAPGLLLYRSNDKKLFIQEEKKWNEIAMEKEIKSEKQQEQTFLQRLKDTEKKLENQINNAQQLVEQTLKQQLKDTEKKLENKITNEQQLVEKKFEQKLKNAQQKLEDQISLLNKTIFQRNDFGSCRDLKLHDSSLRNGIYTIGTNYQAYCDMNNGGWTLIARFSNADSKKWISNGNFWYDRISPYDDTTRPYYNRDMISEAFWKVKANEFKITRSDDSSHTALLRTTSNCLGGGTFRSKITSYGNFRNGAVWASNQCRGSCSVTYGGQYQSTAGFEQSSCSSNIQSSNYIGFWCDWRNGDGAVMMIGGGGSRCERADHGIGITEHDRAKFGPGDDHHDFGNINNFKSNAPISYSLNLWVR